MTSNPYNGFTGPERSRAATWARKQRAAGLLPTHTTCDSCLREGGTVKGHSEDYSAPYGPHIGAHAVCYPCHMAIHCRFKQPAAWLRYRDKIRAGAQYPDTRDFRDWISLFTAPNYQPPIVNTPRETTWLDTLALTVEEATARYQNRPSNPPDTDSLF